MTAKLRRLLIAGTAGSRETEILRAAGAHTVHRTDIQGFLTHIMGTMRMGLDPSLPQEERCRP